MTWGWQDVASLLLVVAAVGYLVRRFVPSRSRTSTGCCGSCPLSAVAEGRACGDKAEAVVSIGGLPQR